MNTDIERIHAVLAHARHEVGKVIIGQSEVVDRALVAILTRGHALIEGVPGVAKTLLVRSLAHVLGCTFHRVQFTPDLMPSDIIGKDVLNSSGDGFSIVEGPIFTTFLMADEINRAPAKTQAALLQAMQERQVTVGRQTYTLSPNFTVFATQNPLEFAGTYPLPEAQKDRFLIKIGMGCPERDEEIELAKRTLTRDAPEALLENGAIQPILTAERLTRVRHALELIRMDEEMVRYIVALTRRTRDHNAVEVGAGPRATQALALASRVQAVIAGRSYVTPDDVRHMAFGCLEHRLVLHSEFVKDGLTCGEVVEHVLRSVPAPQVRAQ